ncbi:restriction endonuclease subunit S [Carnobacterium maltaromaticum]|uniref:restriction endonuclease subunit S n=1 Tax=Carnobacterium maltaromaticum TaxID=2751 RepID=UPI0009CF0785|nr:Predicted protein [Carnobacterium maltaromaticum]
MKNNQLPEVRFPKFKDAWELRKLGEIINISSASRVHKEEWTQSGVRFFRSSDIMSTHHGNENQKAFISNELYENLVAKSGKVSIDDVLVTGGGSVGMPYLITTDEPLYFKDADLIWLKNSGIISGYFLYTFLITPHVRKYIKSISHIGTISHYTIEQVKDTPILLSDYDEQQKIGSFFKQLDDTIALQQSKLKALKQTKQGFLQKMFPKEGEKVPEIRFPGFTDDWKKYKVSEIFTVTRGQVLAAQKTSDVRTDEMKYPVYSSQTKKNGLMGYYNNFLFDEGITWTTDGANAGTVNYREGKFYSTNVNGVLLSNEGYVNKAVAEILNLVAWKYVSKVGNPKLMNNVMSNISISIPKNMIEQNLISDFFKSVDGHIALHQRELDILKNTKKAFLQKMFV